ncbi:MAG: alpha/beta hydrolase [Legionellales bacterium]|nr:alpha/beta hydrolase [Legionellales bacterium]
MDSLGIYYQKFGSPSDQALILISGLGGQAVSWPKRFIDSIVEKKFYVIAFDNRDTGLSKKYNDFDASNLLEIIQILQSGEEFKPPYTLSDMADDILTLMAHLSIEKAHLIGSSMGGTIAQLFAIKYPNKILSLTCLGATTGEPNLTKPTEEVLQHIFGSKKKIETESEFIEDRLQLHRLYNPCENINEDLMRNIYKNLFKRCHDSNGFNRQIIAMMCTKPRTKQLKKVTVPSLIIHGTHDPVFPLDHGEHLAECLSNSRLEVIDELGHGFPERIWNTVARLVNELK